MKKTALSDIHEKLGAKMVPYAGYSMPLQYAGLTEEHLAVRNNVAVFDVSHMGEFLLKGENALKLIQKVTSNDASKLIDGKIQYSCLTNENGGIIDDLLIYKIDDVTYLLVVNASNIEKDWQWIESQNDQGVLMENISDKTSLLAVQGPRATEVLDKLTEMDLEGMKYYSFEIGRFANVDNVLVSATGYTGSGGFEIYFDNEHAEQIWNTIMDAGKEIGIMPAGLAARDTLRLEKGFCLYGNDINETTTPLEAGLGWITKLNKEFVGSDALQKQKEKGLERKLVGFKMIDRGIPRKDYPIVDKEGNPLGMVTSGASSPSLKYGVGLGYVTLENTKEGTEIFIEIRNKQVKAEVVKLPFL